MKSTYRGVLLVSVIALCLPLTTKAQSIEIHGYGGGVFFLPGARAITGLESPCTPPSGFINCFSTFQFADSRERKLQPIVGGGGSISSKLLGVYLDYSYILPDRRSATTFDSATGSSAYETDKVRFGLFQSGLQVGIPSEYKIRPYFQIGAGFLHRTESSSDTFCCASTLSNAGTTTLTSTKNDLLFHYGGGIRWVPFTLHPHFGVRVAIDGYYLRHPVFQGTPSASSSGNFIFQTPRYGFGRATFGFFWQFR
jgi:hypothetical protein